MGSLTLKKHRFTVYFCALDADTYEVVRNPPPSNLNEAAAYHTSSIYVLKQAPIHMLF